MEYSVMELFDLLDEIPFGFEFKPGGTIKYKYKAEVEKELTTKINGGKNFFKNVCHIRLIENDFFGDSKLVRDFKSGYQNIPEDLKSRKVRKIEYLDFEISTSTNGHSVYEKGMMEIIII